MSEVDRLAALARYQILDSEPELAFDEIAELASQICHTPIALISLVDAKRQWLKSRVGLDVQQTERKVAFCHYAIQNNNILMVKDAKLDPRFNDNPLVTGAPHIRFYAGAPLSTPDGHNIGTLCVIDQQARELTDKELFALRILANQVTAQLELRLKNIEQREIINALNGKLTRIRELEGIITICSSCKNIKSDDGQWNLLEKYISRYIDTRFSHGICPSCVRKLYPDLNIDTL